MKMKLWVLAAVALLLLLGVTAPVTAEESVTKDDANAQTSSIYSTTDQLFQSRRDRALARSEGSKRRAKAHRYWMDPWGENQRDAWRRRSDAIAQSFD